MMERLLKVKEAAELLNISQCQLYNLVKKREIPFIRVGKAIRFSSKVLSEWVERKGIRYEIHTD